MEDFVSRRLELIVTALYALLFGAAFFQLSGWWRVATMAIWAAAFVQSAYGRARSKNGPDA